ncbi:hypothetical protein [Ammonifex thiophilus]|uniref:Uncharacterized protein n=1 Tax=Ammonifex thiophilus TaxID=444093 RepID=A0A3D8P2A9_9THEO|nr:hypothetical protein [Ammonifex thiophilus]RDV82337.1 hypothetical protein DXX99_07955 [Ammonifex thiophilus]
MKGLKSIGLEGLKLKGRRKAFAVLLLASLVLSLSAFPSPLPAAGEQRQWAELVTGVDGAGNVVKTRVYGYYAEANGTQVFVVCDPRTGEETGEAYVPGAKVGERKAKKLVGYERKQDLDWDHPKEVKPVSVTLMAPNVPTGWEWDLEHYKQTGNLWKKSGYQFGWPMDYSYARLVPGSDPDYWLVVAAVQNPNPFPVEAELYTSIDGWRSTWWGLEREIRYQGRIPLGPNETKYVLLNRGRQGFVLADRAPTANRGVWCPGFSSARYQTYITSVNDPEYPGLLRTGDKQGFYVPYVTWSGTNPVVLPLIPMRLAFWFCCTGIDRRGWVGWGYCTPGYRGWPEVYGHAEHDPATGEWSIRFEFSYYSDKPQWMSDEEWQRHLALLRDNATTTLRRLFQTWYPKVPFWCSWWSPREELIADAKTGETFGSQDKGSYEKISRLDFYVRFCALEPEPPRMPPPGINVRYGGWRYTTEGAWSDGFDLPAPVLVGFRAGDYRWQDEEAPEFNFTHYSVQCRGGDTDSAVVPRGTAMPPYVTRTDPRYYDPEGWMYWLPVLRAEPVFTDKFTFVATQGNAGYLKKEAIPGYLLFVDAEGRPVPSIVNRPTGARAEWEGVAYLSEENQWGNLWRVRRSWSWDPGYGWRLLGEQREPVYPSWWNSRQAGKATWRVTLEYDQAVQVANPMDVPVAYGSSWSWREDKPAGAPRFYWPGAEGLRAALAPLSAWEGGSPTLAAGIDPVIPAAGVVRVGAKETAWVASAHKAAIASFKRNSWNPLEDERAVLAALESQALRGQLSAPGEAAFVDGCHFAITPTFKPGSPGVISGAKRVLVHQRYKWDSEWQWYVWDELRADVYGFPSYWQGGWWDRDNLTLCSYTSCGYNPTSGLVVRAGDEAFAAALLRTRSESSIWVRPLGGMWNPYETRVTGPWRVFDSGTGRLLPPPYPRD